VVVAGELDRGFDRLRAAVAEERGPQIAGSHLRELARQLDRDLAGRRVRARIVEAQDALSG
jgi:hypothetical protein